MKKNENNSENKSKKSILSFIPFLILFIALVVVYAKYIGTTGIAIREYNIKNGNIPESFDGFSIVQFSDMELGSTFKLEDVDVLVEKINNLKPDVVVFTGDVLGDNYNLGEEDFKKLTETLSKIDPLIGKYSVRGDDDVDFNEYGALMENAGFKDITNDYELIYYKGLTPIVLYGIDSQTKGSIDLDKTFRYPNDEDDMSYVATYRILLAHEPDTLDLVNNYNISLMLSGHSHNSEINIPYIKTLYNIKGASKYFDEKYNIGSTELYISSGLGTSKLGMRLFSKPSISIFRLYRD